MTVLVAAFCDVSDEVCVSRSSTTISVFGAEEATNRLSSDRLRVTQLDPLRTEVRSSFALGREGRVCMLVLLKAAVSGRKMVSIEALMAWLLFISRGLSKNEVHFSIFTIKKYTPIVGSTERLVLSFS